MSLRWCKIDIPRSNIYGRKHNVEHNIQINNRLKGIKGSKEDFGGIYIVAIGDLFQLEPVMDSHIFKDYLDAFQDVLV